jgi:hypothetical protein
MKTAPASAAVISRAARNEFGKLTVMKSSTMRRLIMAQNT